MPAVGPRFSGRGRTGVCRVDPNGRATGRGEEPAMASQAELAAMRRALELARTPGTSTAPNPRVGAVVLDADAKPVGEGRHRGAGTPHAEIVALAQAAGHTSGGTLVVTLEPCNHQGRTGPCAAAVTAAGVKRVVYAQPDDNPIAAGGAQALRDAGVVVEGGVLEAEAERVNSVWTLATRNRRPFVTWKFAATLDGRAAAADGSSRWITGEPARADVHRLRAECDAVVVGTGTILADDPWLTVRTADGTVAAPPSEQPLRVVLGRRPVAAESRVFDDAAPTIQLPTHDVAEALSELFGRDRHHVWLEGGPTLAAAFLRAGLVDEIVAYLAPALLGSGAAVVGDLGIQNIDGVRRFELTEVSRVRDDVRLILQPGSGC